MNTFEKIYSVVAVLFAIMLIILLITMPQMREPRTLLPVGLLGMIVNIGLMFIVLRDILYRNFPSPTTKYLWLVAVFLFWPAILYYLPKFGFRSR